MSSNIINSLYGNQENFGFSSRGTFSKYSLYEETGYIGKKGGITVYQAGTGSSILHLKNRGTRFSLGIDSSDDKYKISRSSSLAKQSIFNLDSNTNSLATVMASITQTSGTNTGEWRSICWGSDIGLYCAIGDSGLLMTSPDGETWTEQTPAETNNWRDVCYSPELRLFVAVSNNGTNRVMYSNNGVDWTGSTVALGVWNCICWSSERMLFCAAGTGTQIMTSPNAVTWTNILGPSSDTVWESICWAPHIRKFVAVSSEGVDRVMISSYGSNWTAVGGLPESRWTGVCWSDELQKLCAVASSGTSNFMNSSDALTWSTGSIGVSQEWVDICWANELASFCAVATGGTTGSMMVTSPDGSIWTSQTGPNTYSKKSICWSPELGRFCGVTNAEITGSIVFNSRSIYDSTPTIQISSNLILPWGITGTNGVFDGTAVTSIPECRQLGGIYLAGTGSTEKISIGKRNVRDKFTIWNDDNYFGKQSGLTIQQFGTGDSLLQLGNPSGRWTIGMDASVNTGSFRIAAGGSTGNPGSLIDPVFSVNPNLISLTGTCGNWTGSNSPYTFPLAGVAWSPELGLAVAVASSGTTQRMISSTNGVSWTARSTSNRNFKAICYSPELHMFVAVSDTGSGNRVHRSTNGTSWFSGTTADETWSSVCWAPELGIFCAVASTGSTGSLVMTSPDGETFTSQTSPSSVSGWSSVCWSPELRLFAAVSSVANANNIMTSPNGTSWTLRDAPNSVTNWSSVCWGNDRFVAVATGTSGTATERVMTSLNGTSWSIQTAASSGAWSSVCWSPELEVFAAVASTGSGRVMTSPNGVTWTSFVSSNEANPWTSICWAPELGSFLAAASTGATGSLMISQSQYANPPITSFTGSLQINGDLNMSSNSGIYTPTFSTETGGTVNTIYTHHYQRLGDQVYVNGQVLFAVSVTGTSFGFDLTVPMTGASTFTGSTGGDGGAGHGSTSLSSNLHVYLQESSNTNLIRLRNKHGSNVNSGTSFNIFYGFSYSIFGQQT